jgi:hypothetical protein
MLLAGFSDDLALVLGQLPSGIECFTIDERTPDDYEVPDVKMVVYVFSPDTGYSSELLSVFAWIHHHRPVEEYILAIRDVDLARAMFNFAKTIPTISLAEIRRRVNADVG